MKPKHVHSSDAFELAIKAGKLDLVDGSPRYAGDWMYMGTEFPGLSFKHRDSRESFYIPLPA